jgi:hypothetical protein
LLQTSYPNREIILIDNGSHDGSGHRLHSEFPSVVFQRLETNRGFAGGNNAGMQIALDRTADYVVLLNNDTVVAPDFLKPLVDLAEADPTAGVQCGKILYHAEPARIWYAGGRLDIGKACGGHRGIGETDQGQYDSVEETGFATGCLFFMPSGVVRDIGLLDESFFAYLEDVDWCIRARRRGYRILYNPRSVIWHKVSVTTRIDSPVYLYLTMRNKLLLARRYGTSAMRWRNAPYFIYFYTRQLVRMSLKWGSVAGTRAVWFGLADGIRGFTGSHGEGRLPQLASRR